MKKFLAIALSLVMVISLAACGGKKEEQATTSDSAGEPAAEAEAPEATGEMADSITLWTYPIGGWGDEAQVKAITDAFTAKTGINVTVEYLTYQDGDDKVNTALTAGQGPDLIMEGPERLVANWGANGYMVDLNGLIDDGSEIYDNVMKACVSPDGKMYEYPLVMTAHCMAINMDAFKEAGADQYVDLNTRTWSTADFEAAVKALNEKYGDNVAAVFCGGQGGDQGTRALVNNMYGGKFTDDAHTKYVWNSPENVKALEALNGMKGVNFDASIVGGDEIALFYNETLKMAFCWNIAQQLNPNAADTGAELTANGQKIEFMAFPTESGDPELCGGIWGFGIFDNGDQGRINASAEFIKFAAASEATADAVKTANYFAVRDSVGGTDISGIWADNEVMQAYTTLMPFLGDYYQVTTNWAPARSQWWNALQAIGAGGDVAETLEKFEAGANAGETIEAP